MNDKKLEKIKNKVIKIQIYFAIGSILITLFSGLTGLGWEFAAFSSVFLVIWTWFPLWLFFKLIELEERSFKKKRGRR